MRARHTYLGGKKESEMGELLTKSATYLKESKTFDELVSRLREVDARFSWRLNLSSREYSGLQLLDFDHHLDFTTLPKFGESSPPDNLMNVWSYDDHRVIKGILGDLLIWDVHDR